MTLRLALSDIAKLPPEWQQKVATSRAAQVKPTEGDLVRRTYGVTVKAGSVNEASRTVDVVASTEALDSYDEIVEQVWDLSRYEQNPVVLYGHNSYQREPKDSLPIGSADPVGMVGGQLEARLHFVDAKANPLAEQVLQGFVQGSLRAVSVGFRPREIRTEMRNGAEVYVLSQNELFEISVVPIPANPQAVARSADADPETVKHREEQRAQLRRLAAEVPTVQTETPAIVVPEPPVFTASDTITLSTSPEHTEPNSVTLVGPATIPEGVTLIAVPNAIVTASADAPALEPVAPETPAEPVTETTPEPEPVEAVEPVVETTAEPVVEPVAEPEPEPPPVAEPEPEPAPAPVQTAAVVPVELGAAVVTLRAELATLRADIAKAHADLAAETARANALDTELISADLARFIGVKFTPAESEDMAEDRRRLGREAFERRMSTRVDLPHLTDVTGPDPDPEGNRASGASARIALAAERAATERTSA